jgi:hypothetical protein
MINRGREEEGGQREERIEIVVIRREVRMSENRINLLLFYLRC